MPRHKVKILLEDTQSGQEKDIGNVLIPGDIDEPIYPFQARRFDTSQNVP